MQSALPDSPKLSKVVSPTLVVKGSTLPVVVPLALAVAVAVSVALASLVLVGWLAGRR